MKTASSNFTRIISAAGYFLKSLDSTLLITCIVISYRVSALHVNKKKDYVTGGMNGKQLGDLSDSNKHIPGLLLDPKRVPQP